MWTALLSIIAINKLLKRQILSKNYDAGLLWHQLLFREIGWIAKNALRETQGLLTVRHPSAITPANKQRATKGFGRYSILDNILVLASSPPPKFSLHEKAGQKGGAKCPQGDKALNEENPKVQRNKFAHWLELYACLIQVGISKDTFRNHLMSEHEKLPKTECKHRHTAFGLEWKVK